MRSAVSVRGRRFTSANAIAPAKSALNGLRAKSALGLGVDLADDVQGRLVAHGAQHPLGVERGRQPPRPGCRGCAPSDARSLTGSSGGTSNEQFAARCRCRSARKTRVALAVPHRSHRRRDRAAASASRRRRCPRRAGRPLRRADRRPDRCSTASADWSGCCRPRCSRCRSPRPGSRRSGLATTLIHGAGVRDADDRATPGHHVFLAVRREAAVAVARTAVLRRSRRGGPIRSGRRQHFSFLRLPHLRVLDFRARFPAARRQHRALQAIELARRARRGCPTAPRGPPPPARPGRPPTGAIGLAHEDAAGLVDQPVRMTRCAHQRLQLLLTAPRSSPPHAR